MKTQKYWIALTLFACATLSNAQQQPSPSSAPSPTPTPVKEYSSSEGRFKALFPTSCTPNEINETPDFKLGRLPFHMLLCVSNTITYSVLYVDYPMELDGPDSVKKALDAAREGSLSRIAKEDPRIVKEFDISIDGHPGRFLQVELKGDAIVRMRYFIAANRVYVVGAGTPKKRPAIVDATDYETLATSFMDALKIIPALEADVSGTWKEFSSGEGRFKIQFPGTPVESSFPAGSSGLMHVAAYKSAALYSAMYVDYFETPKDFVAVMELLDNLRLGEFEMTEKRGMNPKLVSETSISFDGYPGRFLVLEFSNNQIYRRKMVVVKNRVYIVTATAPRDDPKVSNNSYEALSLRFINSFSLVKQP